MGRLPRCLSKDLRANAGNAGSIPVLERSLEKEMATHSSILAWEIPWTEEPVGYSLKSQKESGTTKRLSSSS